MGSSMLMKENEDSRKILVSRFLGSFDRRSMRLEIENTEWKCMGLVANACSSLAKRRVNLRGITIDASIWTRETAVSCRVGLYKLRRPGKDLKKYFHRNIEMKKGDGFGWADGWGGFIKDFSQDTDMAIMDYGEIEIVKEDVLDLQSGGTDASDNRRIKWDVLINDGAGEIVEHDDQGFSADAVYMFSYHLNWTVFTCHYYGIMMYFNFI